MSKTLTRVFVTASAIAVLIAVPQGVFTAFMSPAGSDDKSEQKQAVLPTQQVRFTIYPEGIFPATATVQKGMTSILIEDLADANGGLLVEKVDGGQRASVGNLRRFQNHFRGRGSVELSPGTYELRVPDKSINPAQLIVEP